MTLKIGLSSIVVPDGAEVVSPEVLESIITGMITDEQVLTLLDHPVLRYHGDLVTIAINRGLAFKCGHCGSHSLKEPGALGAGCTACDPFALDPFHDPNQDCAC